jgi:hypothetical protein
VDGQPLTFSLTGLSLPQYEDLTLVPFYQLYECRYQIYFPLYSASDWATKQAELKVEEEAYIALEASTIDKVFCGEQQSESDHSFAGNDSWNGADEGVHWRRTRDRFSYQVKTAGARSLRLKGFADPESVDISIDGNLLPNIEIGKEGIVIVSLPATLSSENGTISFSSKSGSQTPRISEIRLLK